jgi:hypothetical protein
MPIISSGSETATDNGYRQRHICNGSETATNDSFEPLQMIFSIVVNVRGGGGILGVKEMWMSRAPIRCRLFI